MAGELVYLEAIIGADISSFRRGMAEVRGEIAETTGLSGGLIGLGTSLLPVTIGMGILGGIALKTFSDFDSGMRNINSIMQLPQDQFEKLSNDVLKFGEDTRKGTTNAAEALYTIVSAGFGVKDTAEALNVLKIATKGAEAGLADTSTVAQLLAQSLLAYGQGASSASHFMDVLTQTVNLGVGSMDDVAGSIGQVINIASLAKVSFDELGGSAAFLTQRGMSFANAATSINQIITQLIKPSEAMQGVFKELGVAGGTELIEKFHGLGGALQAIATVTGSTADGLGAVFTNVRALRGAASILGNFDDYTSLMQDFGASLDGVTGRAFIQQAISFSSQMDYLKSHIQGFLTTIGKDLAPLALDFQNFFGVLFVNLNKLDPIVVQNAVKLGLLAAAIPVVIILLGALLSPIGLLVIAGAALAKMWSDNFMGIATTLSRWAGQIKDFATGAVKAFNGDIPGAIDDFIKSGLSTDNVARFASFFKDLGDRVRFFVDSFTVNLGNTTFQVGYLLSSLKGTFDKYFGQIFISLGEDISTGNWEKFKLDLGYIWQDTKNLFMATFDKPIGDALLALGETNFAGIALGLAVIAGAFIAVGGAFTLMNLPAIGAAIMTFLVSPIGLVIAALAIGALAIWAYQNNWKGFKDWIDSLGKTGLVHTFLEGLSLIHDAILGFIDDISKAIETVKMLQVIITYQQQGREAALQMYNDLYNPSGIFQDKTVHTNSNPTTNASGATAAPNPDAPMIKSAAEQVSRFIVQQSVSFVNQTLANLYSSLNPNPTYLPTANLGQKGHLITPSPLDIIETKGGSGTAFGSPSHSRGGSGITQNNVISIQSNDPEHILHELQRRGIYIPGYNRG